MAVTGFWPVKGRLKEVLDYADNPEKTVSSDLHAALNYAASDHKTEHKAYTAGINCSRQNAYAEMAAVQKRFGNRGAVVAYHGVQSFAGGEVTPQEALEIGKETARRMWGDRYQVLVAVHLNTENVHCHFVVNPVSFKDGSKFKNKIGDHMELRKISDEICREYGLTVLEDSEFYSKGKKEYWLHKQGKKTHRDTLREDLEYCLSYSHGWDVFERQLKSRGFEIDWTRMSVRAKSWQRSVRLSSLGYTRDVIQKRLEDNLFSDAYVFEISNHRPYKPRYFPLENEIRKLEFSVEHAYRPETVIVDTMFLLFLTLIEIVSQLTDVMLLSPDLRAAAKNVERYRADYHFLRGNDIHTIPELKNCIVETQTQIAALEAERSKADNQRRRAHSPEEALEAKEHKKEISRKLAPLREKLRRVESILEESPHLYELLREEHRLEHEAQRKLERSR